MKSLSEVRETAGKAGDTLREGAQKAAYAFVGAPLVAGRKLADYRHRMMDGARKEFDVFAAEGEKFTEHLRDRKLVTEIKEKVDLDQIQGRVTKIKDQLEDVLAGWRESFRPGEKTTAGGEAPEDQIAEQVAPKKTTAKKTVSSKTADG